MKHFCLMALLIICNVGRLHSQNVSYQSLYNDATFNGRGINTSLAVGSTAGAGSAANGAATYSIPVAVPPGTNGVAPSVSLEYNSMGGNGLLGVGWGVSGLSVISRTPRTFYHDGEVNGVDFSAEDRFAMDGSRLLPRANSAYAGDGNWHGIESENFVNVITHGFAGNGPQWIEGQTLDGTSMQYGNTSDSRIVSSNGTVLAWGINKIIYKDGNYIEFVYSSASGTLLVAEIKYTGNTATGLLPYNKIKFDYKTGRLDAVDRYENGFTFSLIHLLDKITITAESQTVKEYQLNYGNDEINSYLVSISESGSNGSSLNSTVFKYGDLPLQISPSSSDIIQNVEGDEYVGDFNADGISDLLTTKKTVYNNITYHTELSVYAKRPTNPADHLFYEAGHLVLPANTTLIQKKSLPEASSFMAHDFNGDGTDDILSVKSAVSSFDGLWRLDEITVYSSHKDPSPVSWPVRFDVLYQRGFDLVRKINPNTGNFIFAGDFNGDGLQDVLILTQIANQSFGADINLSIASGGSFNAVSTTGTVTIPISEWASAPQIQVLDFNGDGKSDLMVIKGSNCEVFTFEKGINDQLLARRLLFTNTLMNDQARIYLADFNGDRKTDFLMNNGSGWKKIMSKGAGIGSTSFSFEHTPNISGGQSDDQLTIGDLNGDGKSDIYHGWRPTATGANLDVYYSQGNNFKRVRNYFNGTLGNNFAIPADLNGDGRSDIINRTSYNQPFDIFYFKKEGKENLLEKVANGMGQTTEWSYKKLTEAGTFYTQGEISAFPVNNIQPPMYAISEFRAQNGIGGYSTSTYAYEEAKLHRTGKGFLGFKKVTQSDLTMGIKTVMESQLNSAYFVLTPYQVTSYLISDNSQLSQQTFNYGFSSARGATTNNKRFWLRLNNTVENNTLAGGNITTTYLYPYTSNPDYGNPSEVTVNNNNQETTVTSSITDVIYGNPNMYKIGLVTITRTRSGELPFTTKTKYGYNSLGQLTSKKIFEGQPGEVTTTYLYENNLGNVTKETLSAAGVPERSSSYGYDGKGRYPENTTNTLSQQSFATYDARWGQPLTVTGVEGLITANTYDGFGRKTSVEVFKTSPTTAGDYKATTTFSWDISANRVWKASTTYSQSGRAGSTTWFDILGRSIRSETAAFGSGTIESNTVYDSKGNVYSTEQPHKSDESYYITTVNNFDAYNRPASVNAGALGNTTFGYSYSGGNSTVTTNTPAGSSSKTTDLAGKVTSATDNGGTLTYSYYSHGGLKEVNPSAGSGTTLTRSEYDVYGRQTKLTDANAGVTEYTYNALGELTWQKSAKGDVHTMAYDLAGRITSRSGPESPTPTTYEYYTDNVNNGTEKSKGKLKKVTGFVTGNSTEYRYDGRGRVRWMDEKIDDLSHETTYSYNTFGDLIQTNYPSGFVEKQIYDDKGYLSNIKNGSDHTLYSTVAMNGQGQVTSYSKGNGKNSSIEYTNGMPTRYFTPDGIQDYRLTWDYQKGNLSSRQDARGNVNKTESFGYDNLDRLTSANVSGGVNFSASYASNGNINTKTDAGTYSYHGTKFNAVTGATNGNSVVPSLEQNITYTAFQQPAKVTEGQYELNYTYGADYNRIKSELKQNGNTIQTRYYFSGGFEKDASGAVQPGRYVQYISSPVGLIAIFENNNIHYTYTDHLGSILTVTNSGGNIEAEQSFDSWGRRRNVSSWELLAPTAATGLPDWLYRGYTGHEHLDQFGLINMNGRMYDPVLGRMLSPDNYVVDGGFTQDYNRYTYARNNPLVYTDPDGNMPWVTMAIGAVVGGFVNGFSYTLQGKEFMQGFWRGAISGAIAGLTGYYAPIGALVGFAYGAASGAVTGGVGAALNGTSVWKGAAWGAALGGVSGGVMGGIEANNLGANWFTGARPDHYMYADGNTVIGSTQAPYSNEYLSKLKSTNYDDVKGVSGMNMKYRPSDIIQKGDFFVDKGSEAFAVTRYSFWKHGTPSKIYFAKAAFSSKEQLSVVMAHELGHVTFAQSPKLYEAAKALTGAEGLLDDYGHQAIQTMTRDLILKNNWNIYKIGGQVLDFKFWQADSNLLNAINKLARPIIFP